MVLQRITCRGNDCLIYPLTHFYYDNVTIGVVTDSVRYRVERVYQFDLEQWQAFDWKALENIYLILPGWQGERIELLAEAERLPYWFATDERASPVLSASVEPHGIVYSGLLSTEEWRTWQAVFHTAVIAACLPLYTYNG